MEELLIETRKVRKLLEVLVSQTHAEPTTPGIIDETVDNARRFGINRSNANNAMPDPAHMKSAFALFREVIMAAYTYKCHRLFLRRNPKGHRLITKQVPRPSARWGFFMRGIHRR